MDNLESIEKFVRDGFVQQLQREFGCAVIPTPAADKANAIKQLAQGANVTYPYILATPGQVAANPNSYNSHRLSRQGLPVALSSDGRQYRVALLWPANFDYELTFVTNSYAGVPGKEMGVQQFVSRCLLCRRSGNLQFNVNYGLLSVSISYTMQESISFSPRENPAESETIYQVTCQITVHGYQSEEQLTTRGKIHTVLLTTEVAPQQQTGQFIPF